MIDCIKYRSKLSALNKAQSKLGCDFENEINKAKRENKGKRVVSRWKVRNLLGVTTSYPRKCILHLIPKTTH